MNQLVESLKRLYQNDKVGKETIIKIFNDGKITEEEKLYILAR